MLKKATLAAILFTSLLLIGCNEKNLIEDTYEESVEREQIKDNNYSVWTTYWDTKDLENEIESVKDNIDNISYFAAYFSVDKIPFIPKETNENFSKINILYGGSKFNSYLTIVNDLILPDEGSSLKDTDLLYDLFATEESMDNHIVDIIQMTMDGKFDGIEIDYEGIKNDINLWEIFSKFIEKLYERAHENSMLVRVLLEPNTPIAEINLPEGPEYVIMCYNLHGSNTEPGAKADKKFIVEMIEKFSNLPGKVNFALATGGFDFSDNGNFTSITERQAKELLGIYGKTPNRDKESQAMFFNYIDEEEIHHEIWYADKGTINYWINIINEAGHENISIWRIGGNINLQDYL